MNSETANFVTLGYGFQLPETRFMLDLAVEQDSRTKVREDCLSNWSQASQANKERMWNQLSQRYLVIEGEQILCTPFLRMYQKLRSEREKLDLIFYQLCQTTPLILESLRLLARDTLLYTGEAGFTKYHLDCRTGGDRMTTSTMKSLYTFTPVDSWVEDFDKAIKDTSSRTQVFDSFILLPELEEPIRQVLDQIYRQRGRGFFVTGLYGSGKTIFLSMISAILTELALLQQVPKSETRMGVGRACKPSVFDN